MLSSLLFLLSYPTSCSVFTFVFSAGHIHFDDINLDKNYKPEVSYGQSKLANVLFTRELAARLKGAVL